jgi:hyperosmotically inducible protein
MKKILLTFAFTLAALSFLIAGCEMKTGEEIEKEAEKTAEVAEKKTEEAAQEAEKPVEKAGEKMEEAVKMAEESAEKMVEAMALGAEELKKEMAEKGKIIRKKAEKVGEEVAQQIEDSVITSKIKAKYAASAELSAFDISVDTSQGVVNLTGTVDSYESIAKAIEMALDTEGVKEVDTLLQVKEEGK